MADTLRKAIELLKNPECIVCLEVFTETGKTKPKILYKCCHGICLRCLEEKLVAKATGGEIKCPKCEQTYKVTNEPVDEQFKDNFDLKYLMEDLEEFKATLALKLLEMEPNEENLNRRLELSINWKQEKENRLEMLTKEIEEIFKDLENRKDLEEQAAKQRNLAKEELNRAKPKWEATKEKWDRAREAAEKAETGFKGANENLKALEKAEQTAMEKYELALKDKEDAVKAKSNATSICEMYEDSYKYIKQHYEVATTEYENAKPEYDKVTSEAAMKEKNVNKIENEVKNTKVKLETMKKETASVKHNIEEIELAIQEVNLEKAKIEMKRRKPEEVEVVDNTPENISADEYTVRGEEMVAGGGDVARPWGVTLSRTGQTLITDTGNHTLNIVSPQGVKRRIGGEGSGQMGFNRPCDITTNYKEEIMIADQSNRRVKVLSKEGEFERDIEVDGEPLGLCVDNEKNLYVTTRNPPQVIKYNDDGREVTRMRRDEFKEVRNLVHHRGRLYITDWEAHIIHVVTRDLEYVTKIGEGLLKHPTGITIDKHRTLLAGEVSGVVALTLEGEMVTKIAEGRIKYATGITTDQDGDKIIVCDWGNKRVVRL